ncbi:MAG: regulatory iron-sulfur-containing complex subunit RicT [Propionibacteriaceae bacterium]|nr:regulatory iron-sulfur-containing complex subunit RicT [Propionibacteriaceae bacterium]
MRSVMAVTFTPHGRLSYVDPGPFEVSVGDHVLVPTESGPEVAQCVWAPEVVDDVADADLPVCAGIAGPDDLARDAANRKRRAEVRVVANRLIRRHKLPMKVVGVDWIDRSDDFDRGAVIYFTAPGRVDFRLLVGDLARALSARIDLRQVGTRDAARLIGGVGHCGRELCCSSFLTEVEPVALRLAREQNLTPNPLAISGACGKLMCCLKYEHPLYLEFTKEAPPVGTRVLTEQGEATVIGHSVPSDEVVLRMSATGEVAPCKRADSCAARRAYEAAQVKGRKPRRRRAKTDAKTDQDNG